MPAGAARRPSAAVAGKSLIAALSLDKASNERERRLGDFPPAAVNGERVAAIRNFDDFRDPTMAQFTLVRSVRESYRCPSQILPVGDAGMKTVHSECPGSSGQTHHDIGRFWATTVGLGRCNTLVVGIAAMRRGLLKSRAQKAITTKTGRITR